MTAQSVSDLLERLSLARSHNRTHVSDDNPYSESQYKTMKYAPDFPVRFGSFEHARDHTQVFMAHYNTAHRHSGSRCLLQPTFMPARDQKSLLSGTPSRAKLMEHIPNAS
jgi:hypothetical protein